MEDRDTTKRSTGPLSKISVEFGVKSLDERSHEWDFESRPCDGSLSLNVHGLTCDEYMRIAGKRMIVLLTLIIKYDSQQKSRNVLPT